MKLIHPFSLVIIGCQGSGKTFLAKRIVNELKVKGLKGTGIDPNGEYQLPVLINPTQDIPEYSNCVYVFEDATGYFSTNQGKNSLLYLITRRRHLNNSFIFVFHSIRSVPLYISDFITHYALFRLTDRKDVLIDKLNSLNINVNPEQLLTLEHRKFVFVPKI
jgi:GTPase SAR1 family protein